MVFSSALFLFLFLPVVLALVWLLPSRAQNPLLLVASLLFYAWGSPAALVWLLLSITLNHRLGLALAVQTGWWATPAGRHTVVTLAVIANLAFLGWFKYAGFLYHETRALGAFVGVDLPVWADAPLLPIGISFYTFQALSYVVDVARREVPVQTSWSRLALYITFFPQLVAGPIVRYSDFARDLVHRTVTLDSAARGVHRLLIGLCKKLLLADSFAAVVDSLFDLPDEGLTPALARLALLCYALQIYFDFSGYSDMAIGLGLLFGFSFPENFHYPYIARSVTDFWRRWHQSLSTWFRDYLYIPLGGNRHGPLATCRNLLVVFALCGLWHGASWTFLAWGLFHGAFLALERLLTLAREQLAPHGLPSNRAALLAWVARPLGHAYTLAVVVTGWTLFRATDFTQAIAIWTTALGLATGDPAAYPLTAWLDAPLACLLAAGLVAATPLPAQLFARLNAWSEAALTGLPTQTAPHALAPSSANIRPARLPTAGVPATTLAAVSSYPALALPLLWTATRALLPVAALLAISILFAAATYSPFIYFRF
jgi:alginate O-acetyltransferase complex protein AlgI